MTSYAWAVPGASVVCISDNWAVEEAEFSGVSTPVRVPMINEVLTIATVEHRSVLSDKIGFKFEEIDGFYWTASHFRPLVTRTIEDDIAIFAPLLNTREVAQ